MKANQFLSSKAPAVQNAPSGPQDGLQAETTSTIRRCGPPLHPDTPFQADDGTRAAIPRLAPAPRQGLAYQQAPVPIDADACQPHFSSLHPAIRPQYGTQWPLPFSLPGDGSTSGQTTLEYARIDPQRALLAPQEHPLQQPLCLQKPQRPQNRAIAQYRYRTTLSRLLACLLMILKLA